MSKWAAVLASLAALGAAIWLLSGGSDSSGGSPTQEAVESSVPNAPVLPVAPSESAGEESGRTAFTVLPDSKPEPVLPLVVSTRTVMIGEGAPVPHVSVVVGVRALSDGDFPVLARVTTDDQGRGAVSIPWAAIEAVRGKPDGRIWVRVDSPGFRQRARHALLPDSPVTTELQVLAMPGITVRGRLLDAEGKGVGGMVSAVEPKRPTHPPEALANARADGSFELHLTRGGFFDLLADAGEAGTGAMLGKEIRPATPPEVVDVRVRGPGIVRGHVRDSSGKPAAGLQLCIFLAVFDDDEGSFVSRDPEASIVAREGRGRTWATTETAADGSFVAVGLRADRYVVRARTGTGSTYPHLLTPTPVQSDGADLALLFARPHIAVRVIGENGQPFHFPASDSRSFWSNGDSAQNPPDSWPTHFAVLAAPVASEAHRGERSRTYLPARRSGEEVVFEVEEGRRYQVGLVGGSQIWRPTEVLVTPEASRVEITLTVRADSPMGEISVSAFDPERAPVTRVAIVLQDRTTGFPLIRRDTFYEKPWPQQFRVPEGEYRLVVEGAPSVDDWHGTLREPRTCGRFETFVRVVENQVVTVAAHLPRGAKLHLVLEGEVREQDREAIRRRFAGQKYELEYWANRAELTLVPPEGWPEPAMFTMVMTRSSAAGTHLTSALPLGSDSISQILPAGRFRLEARMPGGRVASKEIVLVDGETTDVTLDLDS